MKTGLRSPVFWRYVGVGMVAKTLCANVKAKRCRRYPVERLVGRHALHHMH
jgi:hypothetical protein